MKRFEVVRAQKSCKLNGNCVGLSKQIVLGGGAIL